MSWPFLLIIIPLLRSTRIDLRCSMFQTHIGFLIQHLCIVCVFTLCPKRLVGAPDPLPVSPLCSDWSARPLCSDESTTVTAEHQWLCVTMAFFSNQKMTPVMTNIWECCVGSGCRVGGTLWGSLLCPLRHEERTVWAGLLVSFPGCCVGPARQRDTAELSLSTHTHSQPEDPRSRGWEKIRLSVCVWGAPRIGPFGRYVTKKWKKKNLQRGVLGQQRQVFSVFEFYSLQGVLWGFVTLQTVYMQRKQHNTQGDG